MIECLNLIDGKTIICETSPYNDKYIQVKNPITIEMGTSGETTHIFIDKYLKFTKNTHSIIREDHIIARYSPDKEIATYYIDTVVPSTNKVYNSMVSGMIRPLLTEENTYH